MKTYISVPIDTALFLDLSQCLKDAGDPRDPVEMVSTAIEYWMDNASWKPELFSTVSDLGYQWKALFLPTGTQIRMKYDGEYKYARVEGDQIIYEGSPISPGSLANKIAGNSRNAWRDLWIKRPNDSEWALADDLRPEVRSAII